MRVIVTGSRTWKQGERVWDALATLHEVGPLTVVHGGCRQGADEHTHQWCARDLSGWNVSEEIYSADWDKYGKRAGFIRNDQMVADGADLVLAFFDWCDKIECTRHDTEGDHPSHGAENCANTAARAGIEVIVFWSTP